MDHQDLSPVSLRPPLAPTTQALFGVVLVFLALATPSLLAVVDDHNPIGVSGVFEGVTTTGGAYNVLNHNATRQIDDIVVPGAIGKYGLKMTRYYNSRNQHYFNQMGPGWTHEYMWVNYGDKVDYPNGNVWDSHCTGDWTPLGGPLAMSDWLETFNTWPAFRLADGGTVLFSGVVINGTTYYSLPTYIVDPYGQITTLTYNSTGTFAGLLDKVTEPGGRYLQFTYTLQTGQYSQWTLTKVEAHGLGNGTVTDSVSYTYALQPTGAQPPNTVTQGWCLTTVTYGDSQQASYTYTTDNQPDNPTPPCPCPEKILPLVKTCQDVRYNGPMRQICYDYQDQGPHGAITAERYSLNGSTNGVQVSKITPPAPSPLISNPVFDTTYTETRGDGPVRTFNYTSLHLGRDPDGGCPIYDPNQNPAPQQFLQSYTDFSTPAHTTYLYYDGNWYVNKVTDANGHITDYLRGPPPNAYLGPKGIGQILKITHHEDQTHIDYVYDDESPDISGHYLHSISDERQKVTTYTRDSFHQVTRIDYPSDGVTPVSYEEFTSYNNFGQVLTHHLRNGAWESFVYDSRGLLTDKYNPKQTGIPGGSDPHTHYDYYTAADGKLGWVDRLKKMTLPPNFPSNLQATETYEYDRALGADGTTDPAGTPVPGRGLVTKITHADTPTDTYQSFGYDAYGNKRWEENELRQRTSYTYDDYKRMLTAKNPLNKITTYTYIPTNGGGGSSYKHTTTNPDTVTTPTGIVTSNVYDQNFRKTSTTAAYGTTLAAMTTFSYDNVGNLTLITDPRINKTYNTYDPRNRKLTTTDAYQNALARTTTWHYDAANNIFQIDRADGTQETKTFDAMNRVLTDTVPKTSNPVVNLTTSFTYNPSGTIQKITDPNVHYTWLYYDASDRKTSMTYHDSSTQGWSYDPAGNLQYRVSVNGTTKYLGYDIRDRLYVTTWSNWDDTTINPYWCSFTYDAAGRLSEAENGTSGLGTNVISDVHRYYDAAGRLTQEQQIVTGLGTYSINYPSYDDDGRLTRMSSVSGYDFTYSYDAMGRFEKIFVTGGGLPLFQYYYDAASNETERDNPGNGVNQLTPRDALNRITTWDARKGATTLAHEGYTYDPMDRITVVDWANGHTDSFQYYLDGELNIASLGNFGHTLTYNLDKMGNRTSVVDNTVTSTYSPNTINQYTTVAGSSVANGPEHEIQAYGAVTYVYMNDEHLESVAISGQSPSSATYSMVYDALGRCVKRTLTAGPTTYYIYDGEKPILEYDGTGASAGVNVYGKGIDEIVERVAIGSDSNWWTYYPQQNHEGSVTLLTDGSGNVLERYRYDAFGAPTIYTSTWGARANTIYDNRFLFTGREYAAAYRSTYINAVFSFYEYRARAYNPQLGRFMTEDPKVFDGGDYNLFRYCHNDPIDMTDPTGLDDTAPTYSPRQTSLKEAEDRAYNNIMAKAQMSLSARLEGGAIGASMAAYQGWSQLSEAMNSAHSLTAQSFIQAKSAWGFGGDNHGFTSSPSDAYRTSSTVYFSEGAEGSYVLSDTGKSYFLGRYVGKADASGLTGSAKVNGSVATVNMTGSATNPSPMLSSIAPSIQYNLNATINFGTHALSGSITRTAFPSYQVFLDNKSIYTHAEVGGPGFLYHVFSGTDSLGPSF